MRVRCEVRRRGPAIVHRDRYVGLPPVRRPARKLRRLLPGIACGAALGCWSAMLLLVLFIALVSDQVAALAVLIAGAAGAATGAIIGLLSQTASRKPRRTQLRLTPWRDPEPPLWLASPAPVAIRARSRPGRAPDGIADRLSELLKS